MTNRSDVPGGLTLVSRYREKQFAAVEDADASSARCC